MNGKRGEIEGRGGVVVVREVEIVGFSGLNGEESWVSVACWGEFCGSSFVG